MPRFRSRSWRAALLLTAALLPFALNASHAREIPRRVDSIRVHTIANPFAPFWEALLVLFGKEGSGLDPHGSPAPADAGSGLDPSGSPAPADAGGGLDPHGRPDSLEEGSGLDPSGRT